MSDVWPPEPKEKDTFIRRDSRDPEGVYRLYEFRGDRWCIIGHTETDGSHNLTPEGSYRYYQ